MRHYVRLKPSRGSRIPDEVRRQVLLRDAGCVGHRFAGMPGPCTFGIELDHVRASGALGKKSASTADNLVSLCPVAHRMKTLEGRTWRPRLLAYLATTSDATRRAAGG